MLQQLAEESFLGAYWHYVEEVNLITVTILAIANQMKIPMPLKYQRQNFYSIPYYLINIFNDVLLRKLSTAFISYSPKLVALFHVS